jgi:ATP-dependent protease Clp ATPase subunit
MTQEKEATGLCCSFCHKSQESVATLISTPPAYPRAYICDECIAVCNCVLEDDREQLPPVSEMPVNPSEKHPLLAHPLASSLLTAIEQWIRRESVGGDSAQELSEVYRIAAKMMTK